MSPWLALALAAATSAFADTAGKAGSAQLLILPSARSAAMGEAGAGLSDAFADALALNPAGLGQLSWREAFVSHVEWLEGMRLEHGGYAHPTTFGTLAVEGSMFTVSEFPGFDNSGAQVGSVDARASSLRVAFGGRVAGSHEDRRFGLFLGGGARYVSERLEKATASGETLDAGILWRARPSSSTWGFGLSVLNFGPSMSFDSDGSPPPTVVRLGASWSRPVFGDPLTVAIDARLPSQGADASGLGVEYLLRDVVAWRAGYTTAKDAGSGFRFGVGFNLKLTRIDYALASLGAFGITHRLSASVRFGEPIEMTPHQSPAEEKAAWHVTRAKKLMDERRYYDAVLELDAALRLVPNHADALDHMRKARQRLGERP